MKNSSEPSVAKGRSVAVAPDEPALETHRPKLSVALAVRVVVVVALVLAAYLAARRGIAAWYFSKNDPLDAQSAFRWDPQNPQYADSLAHLIEFYSENPDPGRSVRLYESAVRLSPNDAHYWADLGSAYDRAGHTQQAIHAFETARNLFPDSQDINWRLANFYIREHRADDALPLLKILLLGGGIEDKQVFSLISGAGVDSARVLAKMIPPRARVMIDYLNFQLASANLDAAEAVWADLLKSGLQFRASDSFPYFDALIRDHNVEAASAVWNQLANRFPQEIRPRVTERNWVTNGDFDLPILNGGFDWRVIPAQGAAVRIDAADTHHPSGLLRIEFTGTQNPDYAAISQLVPVQPGSRYEFSADLRAEDITTDSGPRFQISDEYDFSKLSVETSNQIGTSGWATVKLSFTTGPRTRLLVLRIVRPASTKFDNKISGTFSVRHVQLSGAAEQHLEKSGNQH